MENLNERGRKALLAINRALAGGIPSQGIFEAVVAEAVAICDAERGFLLLGNQQSQAVAASSNAGDGRYSRGVVDLVRQQRSPILTIDASEDPRFEPNQSIFEQAIRSVMAAPLIADGNLIGVLYLDSRGSTRNFSEADLELLSAFADQAALALKLAKLKRELERQLEETRELSELADHDGLTGLLNRRAFDRQLEQLLRLSSNRPLALVLLDVDHFKSYNDRNGHPAGDEVLRRLGVLLASGLRLKSPRGSDVAARYGGEEFAIILPQTSLAAARSVAERIRLRVAQEGFPHGSAQPAGHLTISLGVAEAPRHGSTPRVLITAADEALYRAKATGRNQVVCAE